MIEPQRIAEQLRRAYQGGAWHGPAMRELLAGVTSAKAARRPIRGAHSIWEIVVHVTQWEIVVRRRLAGERIVHLPPKEDWPATGAARKAAWRNALENLRRNNRQLCAAIARFPVRRFSETVPGNRYSFYQMLYGAVQHHLYHAGQIALLKKAL